MFQVSELYEKNLKCKKRIRVNQGGTSSGKTYSIMQVLFTLAMTEPGVVISVVGQDIPNLKRGAFRDSERIYHSAPELQAWFRLIRGDRLYICHNGSMIEFVSYDDPQDAKNGKRDYLFINECDGVAYDIYDTLQMKTYKGIFLDYNPTARFWVHDYVMGSPEAQVYISDHRHNPFLDAETHRRLESIPDPEAWRVYARGLTGKLEGLVYPSYTLIDEMPEIFKKECHGLDFGYTNDPSALIRVGLVNGELYLDEQFYKTNMMNPDIAREMKECGITRHDITYADSAEMKSIDEIRTYGLNVIGAIKGPNSILPGIDIVKSYKLNVTRRSANLRKEFNNYRWMKDKNGNPMNKPIDLFNHLMDALRYAAVMGFSRKATMKRGKRRAGLSSFINSPN